MARLTLRLPPTVERFVRRDPRLYQRAVDAAVSVLRGPRSLVPVDTGRLRRSFRRRGRGLNSRVFSPVRYASFVEDGIPSPSTRGTAAATMMVNAAAILRAANARYDRRSVARAARTARRAASRRAAR